MRSIIVRRGMNKCAAPEDGPTFEQQFGILANALVSDKFPKLDRMKLAFQLIEKEDDNSKACGATIYQVGTSVVFVPAFYRGAQIKTGDMMLIADTQQFLPLSDAWLTWLENSQLQEPAELVPEVLSSETKNNQSALVRDINDPIVKTAALIDATTTLLRGMLRNGPETLGRTPDNEGLLNTVLKMGKTASATLLDELTQSHNMLNAALRFYSAEELDGFAKTAAARVEEPTAAYVVLPFTPEAKLLNAWEKQALQRDGFIVKKASETPSPDVIRKENIGELFSSVNGAGSYMIPYNDGTTKRRLLIPLVRCNSCLEFAPKQYGYPQSALANSNSPEYLILQRNGPVEEVCKNVVCAPGAGKTTPFTPDMINRAGTTLKKYLEGGAEERWNSYIVCPTGVAYKVEDFINLQVSTDLGQTSPVIRNGGTSFTSASFPIGSRVVTMKRDDGPKLDSAKPIQIDALQPFVDKMIREQYKQVKLTAEGGDIHIQDRDSDKPENPMSIKEASVKLVADYNVDPAVARTMIHSVYDYTTSGNPVAKTYLISKRAAIEDPMWENADLPIAEVQERPADREFVEMPTITENPEKLRQAVITAAEQGIQEVFDVTTLRLLVRQNRFMEEVREDLPLMMRTLDSLCRKLFVFYWHTDEMEQRFGTVKMKALEDNIKLSLDSLSELTVFFRMRNVDTSINSNSDQASELTSGIA